MHVHGIEVKQCVILTCLFSYQASGVKVDEICVQEFKKMQMKQVYNFLIFRISDDKKFIVVCDAGGPGMYNIYSYSYTPNQIQISLLYPRDFELGYGGNIKVRCIMQNITFWTFSNEHFILFATTTLPYLVLKHNSTVQTCGDNARSVVTHWFHMKNHSYMFIIYICFRCYIRRVQG